MGAMGAMGVMPRLLVLAPPIEEDIGAPLWIPGGAGLGSSRCS